MNANPKTPKNDKVIATGYSEDDFSDSYWTAPTESGIARIDRGGELVVSLLSRLVEIGAVPKNPKVLDVGCGPGRIVHDLMKAGYDALGCEYSESGRRLAKERFNISAEPCDLRRARGIPLPDLHFDFACCVGVMSMIPQDKIRIAIREIERVLKYGGVALFLIVNGQDTHITQISHPYWRSGITSAGFEDVTSLWPPQKEGIGVLSEFCGLFKKG